MPSPSPPPRRRSSWEPTKFEALVTRIGARATFVVLPDIIAGGPESLERSRRWVDWALARCDRALVPVQEGMTADEVRGILSERVGIFVGGLNSVRRIWICGDAGAHSFDGTSASVYGKKTLRKLDGAVRQERLFDP